MKSGKAGCDKIGLLKNRGISRGKFLNDAFKSHDAGEQPHE